MSDIRVGWTSIEDGGPTVRLWFRSQRGPAVGEMRWTRLSFEEVLWFQYHNEHVWIDQASSYEKVPQGKAWQLQAASESDLKSFVIERLTLTHPQTSRGSCTG